LQPANKPLFEALVELVPNPKTEYEDEFEHEYD
jgi:hypothetical protein